LLATVLKLVLHFNRRVYALGEIHLRGWLVKELYFDEKFGIEIARFHFNFCTELDDISEYNQLLCISYEEDF